MDTTGLNITDKVIENFLANVPYDGTLESIINQKYVALFWVGYEAWADYRRTGYPVLTIGSGTFNDHICRRVCLSDQYDGDPTRRITSGRRTPEDLLRRRRRHEDPVWWSKAAVDKGIK